MSKASCFLIDDEIIIGTGFGNNVIILIGESIIINHEPQGSFFFIYDISKFLQTVIFPQQK